MRFGRHAKDEQALQSPLGEHLGNAQSRRVTGCVEVDVHGTVGARVFLFEGAVYSVQAPAFTPDVGRRLLAAAAVSAEQWRALAAAGPGSDAGRIAVAEGWVAPAAVNTVHQEFLLALLGAVLDLPGTAGRVVGGEVTAQACAAPIGLDVALQSVAARRERMADDWLHIPSTAGPAQTVLGPTGVPLPAALGLPEFTVFLESCDGSRTVDEAAALGGFTRAEAVHLSAILVSSGCLHVLGRTAAEDDAGACLVPEALSAERLVARPRREEPPQPVVAPAPEAEFQAAVPEAVAFAEEPPVQPAAVPGVEAAAVDDFDIAALEGELAAAEHWADEVRERLARARERRATPHG